MLRLSKKLACLVLLALSGQLSWGFALLGPLTGEAYQVPTIGYALPGDIGTPKNLGEEFRFNKPVLYFSYDANFLDYFGSNGVAAVDSALAVFNALTNVSQYSRDLSEFPLQATRENYVAEALSLVDLKTWAMKAMVEQLGLAEPERYVWTLHDRIILPGGTCPPPFGIDYSIIQRNFDPAITPLNQFQNSSYVNGTLYSYFIAEFCVTPDPIAVTIPFAVDPLDFTFSAVASLPPTLFYGQYHTGLTRDDVGGLRYLLRSANVNYESTGSNTLAAVTNPVPQLLFTSNLTLLASQALTNDPVTLQTLIPNLNIIASSNYFVNVLVTNVTPYFTNFPWAPIGTGAQLAFATNLVPTIQTRYNHTFGNLLLLSYSHGQPTLVPITHIPPAANKAFITIQTDKIGTGSDPFAPIGTTIITSNSTFTTYLTNAVVGDYVILPTNLCAVDIIASQLTNVTTATNFIGTVTNTLANTNSAGFTNAGTTLFITYNQISYFTNHAFVILPVNCVASGAALFQGIDRIAFVRRDFDSLLGRFFAPITNNYQLNSITNGTLVPQLIQRIVTSPDFLFSATDLATGPATLPATAGIFGRGINFDATLKSGALAGPGTIEPPGTAFPIQFDKVGPIFFNSVPPGSVYIQDQSQASAIPIRILGSFDGSTNAPIVYPNGTSVEDLENQMLIGISPGLLPNGQVGVPYGSITFTATGGQPPYTWSLAPGSPGLPPGLSLLSDGTLRGTPQQDGTFDFTISMTDGGARTVNRAYFITINP